MSQYRSDAKLGAIGVSRAAAFLRGGDGTSVLDVQDDPAFQCIGIDLLWSLGEGAPVHVEVKFERRFTGNLFLETTSNCSTRSAGWLYTTQADLVMYGFQDRSAWWIFDPAGLRVWPGLRGLRVARAKTWDEEGRVLYETEGLLLPIHLAEERRLVFDLAQAA